MGMDVYGTNPKNQVGEYFRRNVWGWHPLWEYCQDTHPDIANKVEHGHSNDGDGLESADSIKLAKALKKDIRSGSAQKYIEGRDAILDALPDEDCEYCDEKGNREWTENEVTVIKKCNACSGSKKVRPFATWYQLELEDIKEFANFLENCGGFSIC
jgi:hypothetical protein